jgi:cytosine/adenosine deaminase-related metal-dependent hydrolase
LGTDSRLSGSRDLLDELRLAASVAPLTAEERLALVTSAPAAALRCPSAGRLDVGVPADLIVIPEHDGQAGDALSACRRHDVQLVVINGRPRVGVPEWKEAFDARGVTPGPMRVDGCDRVADVMMLRAAARYGIPEPGVDLCQ